ncbi:GNAT family N-acetyltransferase [Aliidiomarina maris]|uniref:N-acetyltransferase domain-containing protein n=1 Tax=Aliidiomarina maris TaxID=531312 RepID=A0A327X4D2_9GAMM|nr:GNAT family N-acetyltransferase [Aliidiomarina maris]RAK01601.1 hypothetical protein B0I24_101224 [Aliidiomarina maris]RUO28427.1 hypothetical protein CWE07_01070 [Aliidiomarina maris]
MIREATTNDISRLIELGEELRQQSPTMPAINPIKARKNLAFFMNSKRCAVFVAEHSGEVVGFIVGGIEDNWFSDERSVTDVAFYVRPLYRVYAVGLVKRLRTWGQTFQRVKDITLGISSGLDSNERTGRMYEHLGMQRVGGIFIQRFNEERPDE